MALGNGMRRQGEPARVAVTISDVAKAAGVATSTVSRALGKPGRVSEDMRRRVETVATELGYSPNPQARSLTSGRTHSMALLIPGATNPYFFDLIRGTQAEAKVRSYRHMLVDTEASAEIEATVLAELPRVVDGVVLAGSRLSDDQLLEVSQAHPSRRRQSGNRERAKRRGRHIGRRDAGAPVSRLPRTHAHRLSRRPHPFLVQPAALGGLAGGSGPARYRVRAHRPFHRHGIRGRRSRRGASPWSHGLALSSTT